MNKQQQDNLDLINLCLAIGTPSTLRGVAIHMRQNGYTVHADHLDRIANASEKVIENNFG